MFLYNYFSTAFTSIENEVTFFSKFIVKPKTRKISFKLATALTVPRI